VERIAKSVTLRPVPLKLLQLRSIEGLRSKFVLNPGPVIGVVRPVKVQNDNFAIEQLLSFRIPVVFKVSRGGNIPIVETRRRTGDGKVFLQDNYSIDLRVEACNLKSPTRCEARYRQGRFETLGKQEQPRF